MRISLLDWLKVLYPLGIYINGRLFLGEQKMRYAKLLLVGISVLSLTGCAAEKNLKLCQADNETLTLKVADQKTEMGTLEEVTKEIMTSMLDESKKTTEQLKQAKAVSAKIRKELSVVREARKKDRARMDEALKSIMSKIAKAEKKIKAYESKVGTLEKELAKANKKLKDAESKAAKLTEENLELKAKSAAPPK
jgi:chromosome segregation ATPase